MDKIKLIFKYRLVDLSLLVSYLCKICICGGLNVFRKPIAFAFSIPFVVIGFWRRFLSVSLMNIKKKNRGDIVPVLVLETLTLAIFPFNARNFNRN